MGIWLGKLTVKPGIQETNLNLVQNRFEVAEPRDKFALLCFDEMDIKKIYEYDHKNKQVYGNSKKVMVVMVRSLFSDWKETVYFNFNTNMTKDLLSSIILECESKGIQICGVTFDCGNPTFLKDVNFHILNNKFPNPANPLRFVYLLPDVPHLLKLFRNHCIDKGFSFPDEKGNYHNLTKSHFEQLMKNDGSELKICPKLKTFHVEVKGSQRQRVRPAAQLFSATTAKALYFQGGESLLVQSKAVLTVNSWFDTMNSRRPYDAVPERCSFGINLTIQQQALAEMKILIENMKFLDKPMRRVQLPFQKGILISIKSTNELFADLKSETGLNIKHLMTNRLNQDFLENRFSRLRGVGGDKTHPGPVCFMNRMKSLALIISDAASLVAKPNVEDLHVQNITPGVEDDLSERTLTDGIMIQEDITLEVNNILFYMLYIWLPSPPLSNN